VIWKKVGKVAARRDPRRYLGLDRPLARRCDRSRQSPPPLIPSIPLLVGVLILWEVLQGLRSEREARLVERGLRRFETVSLLDPDLAVKAAANYRFLRGRGSTIRKTIDLLIGTFCIECGHLLLHDDRDFEPMVRFLGLRTA
jgi:predicted nucleic acid-binding protein